MKPLATTPGLTTFTVCAAAAVSLAACGGGGGGSADSGTLRLALTDAPACGYDHVYVNVDSVQVHQSATAGDGDPGWVKVQALTLPRRIDLLALSNGVLEELGQTALPAGRYTQMRLVLASDGHAVVPSAGSETPLKVPSGSQSGLKLNVSLDVQPGQIADWVLDFNACRSVVTAGKSGSFNLKPVIAVLPRVSSAMAVEGHVGRSTAYSSVSLQLNGVVVRSTVPDPNRDGYFVLPYLPVAGSGFDLVISDPARGTRVVTSVPVSASAITRVEPITLSDSATQRVSGAVSSAAGVPAATVTALQQVAPTRSVELASRPVDALDGSYSFSLATAPLQTAPYAAAGLSWSAYDASAGRFTLRSDWPGSPLQQQWVDLRAGSQSVGFSY